MGYTHEVIGTASEKEYLEKVIEVMISKFNMEKPEIKTIEHDICGRHYGFSVTTKGVYDGKGFIKLLEEKGINVDYFAWCIVHVIPESNEILTFSRRKY